MFFSICLAGYLQYDFNERAELTLDCIGGLPGAPSGGAGAGGGKSREEKRSDASKGKPVDVMTSKATQGKYEEEEERNSEQIRYHLCLAVYKYISFLFIRFFIYRRI